MIDCKNCGMDYEQEEFSICPYCGEEPAEESKAELEKLLPGTEQEKKTEKKLEAGRPKSKIKFALIALAALAVVAVAISAIFALGDSEITVPDKYATIQEAIDDASDGDEIVVQVGRYQENIDFRGKNIILRSIDPDDEQVVEQTIIDGGGSGTVVSFRSGESKEAVLSGFTVTRGSGILISGGSAPLIEKCIIEDNVAEYGAGIAIFDSSPSIVGNTIIGNAGFLGGGLFIEESSPLIQGNTIIRNRAEMGSGMVIISNSAAMVIDNTIADNVAARLGGGVVVAVNSTPSLKGNNIVNNNAERNGGGLLIEESEPIVEDNIISGNRAGNGAGIFIVNTMSTALRIVSNEIKNNLAFIAGGGLYMEGSSPTIEGNIFERNLSDYLGGAMAVYNSVPIVIRNTFENNEAGELEGGGAIWVSEDSELELNDPDDNTYLLNIPDDIFLE